MDRSDSRGSTRLPPGGRRVADAQVNGVITDIGSSPRSDRPCRMVLQLLGPLPTRLAANLLRNPLLTFSTSHPQQ